MMSADTSNQNGEMIPSDASSETEVESKISQAQKRMWVLLIRGEKANWL